MNALELPLSRWLHSDTQRAGTSRGPEREQSRGRSGIESRIARELPLSRWLHSDAQRAGTSRAPERGAEELQDDL